MKKLLMLFLVLVVVFCIAGCDKTAQKNIENIENIDIAQLEEKYPEFFNISTDGGLKIYIWQMSENNYKCYPVNAGIDATAQHSLFFDTGASIPEMRAILSTYEIKKEDVIIQPTASPISSYYYKINDDYCEKIKKLFWEDI